MNTEEQNSLHALEEDKTTFGFWIYLMTDCMLFAAFFATYAVLRGNTFGGLSGRELLSLPYALAETLILLTSSFVCGLVMLAVEKEKKNAVIVGLGATFILGASFLVMEFSELSELVKGGNGPQKSGFLTSLFSLLGLHGLHIAVGLLWIIVLAIYLAKRGLTENMKRKLLLFSLYWHFLDIIWIFIFTIVYLYGHI